MKKVAVIGYGSIGKEIIASAKRQEIPNAKIIAVFDKQSQVVNSVDNEYGDVHLFSDFDKFYNSQTYSSLDIVIECASKDAVREFGKK